MLVTTIEPHMVFLFVCARVLNVSIVSVSVSNGSFFNDQNEQF